MWEERQRFFSSVFSFGKKKVTINENVNFTGYTSGIRHLDCSKLAINWKKDNDVTISRHYIIVKFFWSWFVSLVKFSYWYKFHVNIITCSGVKTIFFYKELTRNPKIGNKAVWVLFHIWRLGRAKDTKSGTNISYEMLLNFSQIWCYLREVWHHKEANADLIKRAINNFN